MARSVPAFALLAVLVLAPAVARTADQKALRTLTYHVEIAINDKRDTPGGGISGTQPGMEYKGHVIGGGNATRGSGESEQRANVTASGAIDVAVVEATVDLGLVVDIAEDAAPRVRPTVRVAIAPTGDMVYNKSHEADLSEEEFALLRWLARGFFGEHSTAPGTFWTVDQSTNGMTAVEHYRVLAVEAPRVTLDYALDEKTPGSDGYSGRRTGSLVYDTALVVPVKAGFREDARRMVDGAYDTLHSTFAFTLTSDSFASRH